MEEREYIVMGYTTTTDKIIIEGFCEKGKYNVNLAEKSTNRYDKQLKIDITELTPEQIFKEYSETIKEKHVYTSIITRGNNAKISTIKTAYPLKHVLFSLLKPGNHIILYGGNNINDIEINITSSDYYYGEETVITSSEVTSM